jgi:hypothetical protein
MSLDFWRDVSLVWLSLLCFVAQVVPLVALYFAVRGMHTAHQASLHFFRRAQGYSQLMRRQSDELSRRVATPVMQTSARLTRLQTTWRRLWAGRL